VEFVIINKKADPN